MPDRGKERDGTDGIMLPSNLLLRWEQTAATHGHTGDTAPATLPSLTCSQGALPRLLPCVLGSLAGSWGGQTDMPRPAGPWQTGNGVSPCYWHLGPDLLATLQSLWPAGAGADPDRL